MRKKDGRKRELYPWVKKWSAQVDLTLVVQDTKGMAVAVSVFEPFKPAVLPGIGSFAQNFTLGLNGGVNETATRTEQLSFTVRLDELEERLQASRLPCPRQDSRSLDANLGIAAWLDKVMEAVDNNVVSNGGPKPKIRKAAAIQKPRARPELSSELDLPIIELEADIDQKMAGQAIPLCPTGRDRKPIRGAGGEALTIKKSATDEFRCFALLYVAPDGIGRDPDPPATLEPARNWAKLTKQLLEAIEKIHKEQLAAGALKSYEKVALDGTPLSAATLFEGKDAKESVIAHYYKSLRATLESINAIVDPKAVAPLEAVNHQVSFVVVVSGSASPNWTLVRVRGPNTGGPAFASASRSRSHGLVLTLGEPGSEAAKNARAAASISSALKNSGVLITP